MFLLSNTSLTQTICSGASTSLVTLTSIISETTFAWTATATAGMSGLQLVVMELFRCKQYLLQEQLKVQLLMLLLLQRLCGNCNYSC
jgi:hypothetical protein